MTKPEEGTVTLREETPVKENVVTEASMKDEGFFEDEITLAKEHGIIKEEKKDEHEGKPVDAGKKDNEVKAFSAEDLDSFEKVHEIFEKQPEKFRELPRNVKALYHNSKGLYKKAKVEEQKRIDMEKRYEFDALKNKAAENKVQKIAEALKQDKITVEEIEAIIGAGRVEQPEPKDDKEAEAKRQQDIIQSRIAEADKLGRTEYEDFDSIVSMAQAVMSARPRQLKMLQDALVDDSVSEKELVDMVVDVARLHENFGKKTEKKEDFIEAGPVDEKADRMIKNSQKKPTSAALGGGSGSRTKSYAELTPEDVARMDFSEYKKLPEAVRRRLKEGL